MRAHDDGHAGPAWPSLMELYGMAREAQALSEAEDRERLRGYLPGLREAGLGMVAEGVPKSVSDPFAVKLALEHLDGHIRKAPETSRYAEGVLPRVVAVMEAAGVAVPPDTDHGPHDGNRTPFSDARGGNIGKVELKLHDDKGDLELWLTRMDGAQPFDLPLDTLIHVRFSSHGGREVTLRIRDARENPDEEGTPNIREGKTHYFIFPGDTGADASWLRGEAFRGTVAVTFQAGGQAYRTEPFELKPHAEGHGHTH